MRFYHFFVLCLTLVLCLQSVAAVPYHAIRRQGDDNTSQAPSSTTAHSVSISTTVPSSIRPELASSTAEGSTRLFGLVSATLMQVPSTTDAIVRSSTPSAEIEIGNPLPLHPKVTPAMALAGALLLITGLIYAVIGIKNKWIYVFGSAAYLTALAVTVLIVYLMNPPVSNGIQGAFFVAAFFTGCIFGVLSLVFADITEGFGCLLGGFCLSMWFLSLKDGGLISSTTGRAIFIGCMSAGGFSLSFSHYTRNYGLIASISFSGATATILGVDCLSCAGWKEFWLYLWNLNEDIFPLNTNTYPVTKNIKAELAGIVIIAVFGAVSQLRVWNMVKDRRAKSAAQELERQQAQDLEDEARGRNVEDTFQKERTQWEAAYGNKNSIPDSSVRTSSIASPKGSTSIKEEMYATDSMEVVNYSKSGVAAEGTTVTVSVLRDDDIHQIDGQGNPITNRKVSPVFVSDNTNRHLPRASKPAPVQRTSLHSAVPPPPPVVPLPFTVPIEEVTESENGDSASVSAVPESSTERKPMSKRVSDMAATNRLPMNRASRVFSESSEVLAHDRSMEADCASSVAATLDDDNDNVSMRQLSPPHSPIGTEYENPPESPTFARKDSDTVPPQSLVTTNPMVGAKKEEGLSEIREDNQDHILAKGFTSPPAIRQSLTSSTDPKPNDMRKERLSVGDARARVDTVVSSSSSSGVDQDPQSAPSQASQAERAESHIGSLQDGALPERLSKVALSYRTNEWAKHLEAAEKPELDDLRSPVSPSAMEKPVPVSDEIVSPLIGSKRESRRVSSGSRANRKSDLGLNRPMSTFFQQTLIDQHSMARSPPITSPAISPGVLSRSNSGTQLGALAPLPSNTLIGQRDTLMRKRTSSQSFTPNTSAANLLEQADQENMSLAQRRQILQHHQATQSPGLEHGTSTYVQKKAPPSSSQKWQKKGWATKGAPVGFDAHQPRRTSSTQSDQKREELYAGWRNKIQDVTNVQSEGYIAEQQRVALLNERRQNEMQRQQREAKQQQRASQLDSMMRSGHMLDAHREAMRKMQANASRNAS